MFTAIFSTISIIEDRREGFLQGVLVAPIPRAALVLGKLSGGTVLAVVQAAIFLVIGPALRWVGLAPHMSLTVSAADAMAIAAFLTLEAFALTALGYVMAWPLDSTQGFHALMSIFLFPMWLLSGAFFPIPESGWLSWLMRINPLTYGVAGLQRILFLHAGPRPEGAAAGGGLPSLATCVGVTILFCAIGFAASVWLTGRRTVRNAR
jgi:ABC-2 type transport system permease protein